VHARVIDHGHEREHEHDYEHDVFVSDQAPQKD
jgi:hypothetical protein